MKYDYDHYSSNEEINDTCIVIMWAKYDHEGRETIYDNDEEEAYYSIRREIIIYSRILSMKNQCHWWLLVLYSY